MVFVPKFIQIVDAILGDFDCSFDCTHFSSSFFHFVVVLSRLRFHKQFNVDKKFNAFLGGRLCSCQFP